MSRNQLLRILYGGLVAMALAGCAATKPISEWRDPNFSGQVDHILIIAVTVRSERRRAFEAQFVEALAARGIAATPSYKLLTSSLELTRETVEDAIEGRNIGAVLVTRLAGIKDTEVYRESSVEDRDRYIFSYHDHAISQTTPGYYEDYRVLTLETNLYETGKGELVWKMQSEAIDASRPKEVIAAQIELTIKTLAKRKLIAPGS